MCTFSGGTSSCPKSPTHDQVVNYDQDNQVLLLPQEVTETNQDVRVLIAAMDQRLCCRVHQAGGEDVI